MNRLIRYNKNKIKCNVGHCPRDCNTCGIFNDIRKKLLYYEDLEEQGRLIKLPCKVGTPIYYISKKVNGRWYVGEYYFNLHYVDDFGKTVFLTREEAEAKMEELNEKTLDYTRG